MCGSIRPSLVRGVMTKRVYKSYVDSVGVKGGVPVKWDDRMLEYLRERN